jgi:hypothetical protein
VWTRARKREAAGRRGNLISYLAQAAFGIGCESVG